jgi:CRISPR/Cas system-associated exonuclease Cas4 (RecB family)
MTQDEIIEMANKAGNGDEEWLIIAKQLFKHFPEETQRFAVLVAEHEREACAKVCDEMEEEAEGTECCKWPTPIDCAYVIRARGQA